MADVITKQHVLFPQWSAIRSCERPCKFSGRRRSARGHTLDSGTAITHHETLCFGPHFPCLDPAASTSKPPELPPVPTHAGRRRCSLGSVDGGFQSAKTRGLAKTSFTVLLTGLTLHSLAGGLIINAARVKLSFQPRHMLHCTPNHPGRLEQSQQSAPLRPHVHPRSVPNGQVLRHDGTSQSDANTRKLGCWRWLNLLAELALLQNLIWLGVLEDLSSRCSVFNNQPLVHSSTLSARLTCNGVQRVVQHGDRTGRLFRIHLFFLAA